MTSPAHARCISESLAALPTFVALTTFQPAEASPTLFQALRSHWWLTCNEDACPEVVSAKLCRNGVQSLQTHFLGGGEVAGQLTRSIGSFWGQTSSWWHDRPG